MGGGEGGGGRGGGGEVGGVKYEPKTKARLIDELTLVVD